jgi:hypothetical protein
VVCREVRPAAAKGRRVDRRRRSKACNMALVLLLPENAVKGMPCARVGISCVAIFSFPSRALNSSRPARRSSGKSCGRLFNEDVPVCRPELIAWGAAFLIDVLCGSVFESSMEDDLRRRLSRTKSIASSLRLGGCYWTKG